MLKEKILLWVLPFWDPLIPPQGISCLKNFIKQHGYMVKTIDTNTKQELKEYYNSYFGFLRENIPEHRWGNFFNMGHDVLRNHLMAHLHHENQEEYIELVRILVYQTYFTGFNDDQVRWLIKIINSFYNQLEKYLLRVLEEEKPDVVGVTVLRDTVASSLFTFKLVKEKYPHIMTVMGGSIFSDHLFKGTPNFRYFLERTPYIDKIIIGEGQNLFLKLLQGELPLSQRVFTLADINGETLGFSPLNFPDMSDFQVRTVYPYLAAQASAGCPFRCSFCNVAPFYGEYRQKEPRQVVEEMTKLYHTYGSQLFFMNDALMNPVIDGLSRELIKSGVSLYWDGYLRVDESTSDIENTMFWRQGGFYRARIGVESGSQRVLDLIGKKITVDQTRAAVASLAYAGIKTTAYIVVGHPGETQEDFQKTLDLLEELKNDIWEAECNPFIYGYDGQVNSAQWVKQNKLLYPAWAKKMLMIQTWVVDAEPSREETYNRVCRLIQHCNKMGIPNPYSLSEIYQADERWKKLHKNAVPGLIEFKDKDTTIDDTKDVRDVFILQNKIDERGDFAF
ncbi:MAG: radical SAM protein [Candidatus Aminicenantes bacterium]|nr:MAG: radical SAM protein [Candidatus Aminicenantes bacterium]